jgi:predicted nucleic acid-binding Zn ribbon protein
LYYQDKQKIAELLKKPWNPYTRRHSALTEKSTILKDGLIDKGIQIDQLRPKQCPNCSEPNKPDSKFCAKCRIVLSYDTYNETVEMQHEKDRSRLRP